VRHKIIPSLNLIVGENPKSGCTAIFHGLLKSLGFDSDLSQPAMIHDRYFKQDDLKVGRYGIYDLIEYSRSHELNLDDFHKIAIIRNPYERFISGFRQQAKHIASKKSNRKLWRANASRLLYKLCGHIEFTGHFMRQADGLLVDFDQVIDVSEMGELYKILGVEYDGDRGRHKTKYTRSIKCHSVTLRRIFLSESNGVPFPVSSSISDWLTESEIKTLEMLYFTDFHFAEMNGIDYSRKAKVAST